MTWCRTVTGPRRRLLALVLLLLVVAPTLIGCVRIRASMTVSPDDRVSGQIVAAAKSRDADDKGPQLLNNLPFAQKVAVSDYNRDDYVGSQAVFSDLSFAELPQLAEHEPRRSRRRHLAAPRRRPRASSRAAPTSPRSAIRKPTCR